MVFEDYMEGNEPNERIYFELEDAENILRRGLKYYVGDNYQWLPEYDEIVKWLSDNDGKGLLCLGDCGRGKSVICYQILKDIFGCCFRLNYLRYDAVDMGDNLAQIKESRIAMIDDVGTELPYSLYGVKRECFSEIVDRAEKDKNLLVITTNLSLEQIIERYGNRTFDRLRATTKPVLFAGDSLRK